MNDTDIIAFIDAPDPDNFVQLLALRRLYPNSKLYVSLTGRPVKFGAKKEDEIWDYDLDESRLVQRINAARILKFLETCGCKVDHVYDGGIAPRTLVPHWVHFPEYKGFNDIDPVEALQKIPALQPAAKLIKAMLSSERKFVAVVGGPMTGLYNILVQCPKVAATIAEVHAMFATWGKVELMQFGGAPRGALQFNAACDPLAAQFVLTSLPCPIYLAPTEVTRVEAIAFADPAALQAAIAKGEAAGGAAAASVKAVVGMYETWFKNACAPRKEIIYIHDLAPALTADRKLREAVYDFVPIDIAAVPASLSDAAQWGVIQMKELEAGQQGALPRFAAKACKAPAAYLAALQGIFSAGN
eukprot:tig00000851_g4907.t1